MAVDLGQLYVVIGARLDDLTDGVTAVERELTSIAQIASVVERTLNDGFAKMTSAVNETTAAVRLIETQLGRMATAAVEPAESIREVGTAAEEAFSEAVVEIEKVETAIEEVGAAAEAPAQAFQELGTKADRALDQAAGGLDEVERAVVDVDKATDQLDLDQKLTAVAKATEAPAAGFSKLQANIVTFNQAVQLIGRAADLVGRTVGAFTDLADKATLLDARLRDVTGGGEAFAVAQQGVIDVANDTRQSIEATSEIYIRMANATKDLGVEQGTLLRATETLNKAVVISGATAQEAEAALIQLSQGMASGRLQGEELRSVLEQLPIVARLISKETGIAFGDIREAAAEGRIGVEDILNALVNGADEIDKRFGAMRVTVGQAWQGIENAIFVAVGEIDPRDRGRRAEGPSRRPRPHDRAGREGRGGSRVAVPEPRRRTGARRAQRQGAHRRAA